MTMAVRMEIVEAMRADPLWSKALEEAYEEYVKTGKSERLREVVEDYCRVKGLRIVRRPVG